MRQAMCAMAAVLALATAAPGAGARLESPEKFLGFKPGADYKLAGWEKIEGYFRQAGRASDRVRIQDIGRSSEGRRDRGRAFGRKPHDPPPTPAAADR